MLKALVDALFGKVEPNATVVWHCDPLVIVDPEDRLVFAEVAEVEFTPEGAGQQGLACLPGGEPRIHVQERIDHPNSVDVHIRTRGGFTLIGHDAEGRPTTWAIGRAADDILRDRGRFA